MNEIWKQFWSNNNIILYLDFKQYFENKIIQFKENIKKIHFLSNCWRCFSLYLWSLSLSLSFSLSLSLSLSFSLSITLSIYISFFLLPIYLSFLILYFSLSHSLSHSLISYWRTLMDRLCSNNRSHSISHTSMWAIMSTNL